MGIFLVIAITAILAFLLYKGKILDWIGEHNKLVQTLKQKKFFQSYLLGGVILFFINGLLFVVFSLLIFLVGAFIRIPFLHIFFMIVAGLVAFYTWGVIYHVWEGTAKERLKMGLIGSSFFGILAIQFIYSLLTFKPSSEVGDLVMATVGLWFGIIVTLLAFISCFIYTALENKVE